MGEQWPSMRAKSLRNILVTLCGKPEAQRGSHAKFRSRDGERRFTFAYHDNKEVTGGVVRSILVDDVGLTLEQARRVARKGKL